MQQNTTDDSNRITIKIDERDSYPAPPTLSTKEWTFETAIQQLEYCEYEAIGGKLIWNDAFIWLKNKHRSDVEKLEADHKKEISSLEAQVKEKDDQIEAAMFSGTLGEIIKTQKEQIAALTAERDLWREAHHACDKDNSELLTENAVLIEAVEMLIKFIPDGWSMPLGYTQVVAQAREALDRKEEKDE